MPSQDSGLFPFPGTHCITWALSLGQEGSARDRQPRGGCICVVSGPSHQLLPPTWFETEVTGDRLVTPCTQFAPNTWAESYLCAHLDQAALGAPMTSLQQPWHHCVWADHVHSP